MTDRTASQKAAARLGIGADHDDIMSDAERLLARGSWSERDRLAARSLLARARDLGEREEGSSDADDDRRPATASEIAGAHMLGGKAAARELRERGVEK
ncbi:hypothetical protein [Microbacterium sp. MTN4-26]|uniref:hypothetical protein n=1 Tax=unclassified Microbacterium TaxID=2609290 RepID=UPI0036F36E02